MSKEHDEGRWNLERDSIFLFPFFSNHLFSLSLSFVPSIYLFISYSYSYYPMYPLCASLFFCRSLSLFVCVSLSVCFSFNTCLYPSLYATPCLHHSLSFFRLLQYLVSHTLGGHIVDYLISLSSSDPV